MIGIMKQYTTHIQLENSERRKLLEEINLQAGRYLSVCCAGMAFYDGNNYPIYNLHSLDASDSKKNVLITAGMHGSEPGSVYAIMDIIETVFSKYGDVFNFTIFPCVNPAGFLRDTRENPEGIDINKSFDSDYRSQEAEILSSYLSSKKFDIAINLHEDNPIDNKPEEKNPADAYMYLVSDRMKKTLGYEVLRSISDYGYPVTNMKTVYDEICDQGLIWSSRGKNSSDIHTGTLELFLEKITDMIFTLETPTDWNVKTRIKCLTEMSDLILEKAMRYH